MTVVGIGAFCYGVVCIKERLLRCNGSSVSSEQEHKSDEVSERASLGSKPAGSVIGWRSTRSQNVMTFFSTDGKIFFDLRDASCHCHGGAETTPSTLTLLLSST